MNAIAHALASAMLMWLVERPCDHNMPLTSCSFSTVSDRSQDESEKANPERLPEADNRETSGGQTELWRRLQR